MEGLVLTFGFCCEEREREKKGKSKMYPLSLHPWESPIFCFPYSNNIIPLYIISVSVFPTHVYKIQIQDYITLQYLFFF